MTIPFFIMRVYSLQMLNSPVPFPTLPYTSAPSPRYFSHLHPHIIPSLFLMPTFIPMPPLDMWPWSHIITPNSDGATAVASMARVWGLVVPFRPLPPSPHGSSTCLPTPWCSRAHPPLTHFSSLGRNHHTSSLSYLITVTLW